MITLFLMVCLGWLVIVAILLELVKVITKPLNKKTAEIRGDLLSGDKTFQQKRRRSIDCKFNDGLSFDDFKNIVMKCKKYTVGITYVCIEEACVHGYVKGAHKEEDWEFLIDFNDYGHITGRHWISYEKLDSDLPIKLAKRVQKDIQEFYKNNRGKR